MNFLSSAALSGSFFTNFRNPLFLKDSHNDETCENHSFQFDNDIVGNVALLPIK